MSYADGFRDALDLVERMLIKKGTYSDDVREVIEYLRAAVIEKKAEKLLFELGL